MKAWEIRGPGGIDALVLGEREAPRPGPGQVLLRVRAASLNYRDLSTVEDPAARAIPCPRVPGSDAAGEVVETGAGVTRFAPGDRVAGCFFQRWPDGAIGAEAMASALGGPLDGVLAERVVLAEDGAVAIPSHLGFEEAACLPCAALTAWHSIAEVARLGPGDTVLLLGTGGVSVFALQLSRLHGARAVVTSSSDEKLARAEALGAWRTVNYRSEPEWQQRVLDVTDGRGVDHVLEVGGAGTLQRSLAALRVGGSIGFVGILAAGTVNPTPVMSKSVRLQGIYVGSRAMFERMNRAISAHELRPVIDRVFPFADTRAAFHHMRAGAHFGKIVVRLDGA